MPTMTQHPKTLRLVLHLAYGSRGERLHGKFFAHLDGRQICISRQPLLDAARILLAEGVGPKTPIITRHVGEDFDAVPAAIYCAIVVANGSYLPRIAVWRVR